MKIMFMGTPEISATCLRTLIAEGENVIAVVTGVDKPRGRGNVMTPTPTKSLALEHGIPVYTPKTLRDGEFDKVLKEIDPELIVVVAYGKILPESVINYPKYGCINVHVSLLPKYRGAAPMQRAIMEGEKATGVTIMHMDVGLDTGDIISQVEFPIFDDDTFETIHDESAEIGSDLLVRTIRDIEAGTAVRIKQDDSLACYAATPIPGAFCFKDGKMLKLFKPSVTRGSGKPGEVIDIDPKGEGSFTVACGEGALLIRGVIPEGKGRMTAGDYIRGRKISKGDILE